MVPSAKPRSTSLSFSPSNPFVNVPAGLNVDRRRAVPSTVMRMAQDDFNEAKYTEAAWSLIVSLTKAADFYEAQNVDAPLLLDIILNPSRHQAGDNAESARRVAEKILKKAGASVPQLKSELEEHLAKQPRVSNTNTQKTMSRSLQQVLDASKSNRATLGDSFVSTEGLLLALVKEDSFTRDALLKQDVKYNDILQAVKASREKSGPATTRAAETNYDALLKYGVDFTERAREGKLDPVIGRDAEIRRAIQILSRRSKNNPVLIGDPGVGKTALCEGIAQRMVSGDVPDSLQNCRLIGLDLAALVAGASMRGT